MKEAQGKYGVRNIWTIDCLSYIKKTIEYLFEVVLKHYGEICVNVDNILFYFKLFIGISGYVFMVFCISMSMVYFIGNTPLNLYDR